MKCYVCRRLLMSSAWNCILAFRQKSSFSCLSFLSFPHIRAFPSPFGLHTPTAFSAVRLQKLLTPSAFFLDATSHFPVGHPHTLVVVFPGCQRRKTYPFASCSPGLLDFGAHVLAPSTFSCVTTVFDTRVEPTLGFLPFLDGVQRKSSSSQSSSSLSSSWNRLLRRDLSVSKDAEDEQALVEEPEAMCDSDAAPLPESGAVWV